MSAHRKIRRLTAREDGVAMITTLMVLVLVSALMVGFITAIVADQRASGLDRDQTQAYAAAHAGLEQLTADLSSLFAADFAPDAGEITTLTSTPPNVPNFTFEEPGGGSGYRIGFNADPNTGNPMPESTTGTTISAGPYQGLRGVITPYNITVTARSRGGAEVRMRRTLQTVSMPVFQFGFFSDSDLGFHADNDFQFGGRVHTNGSLYLAHAGSSSNRLTLPDRITAVNEVIRTHLMNGYDATSTHRGTVRVIRNPPNNYRNLAADEGSLVANDFTVLNEPKWTALSVGTYASNIRNGRTGARRLELPLQTTGNNPVEIIRRPATATEHTTNLPLFNQRLYTQASIRIMLSDTAAALTNATLPTATASAPQPLDGTPVAGGYTPGASPVAFLPPLATSGGGPIAPYTAPYASPTGTTLIGGYLKIEQRTSAGWQDVTVQIMNFGIAGRNLSTGVGASWNAPYTSSQYCREPNPDAIIRLQRVKDVAVDQGACGVTPATGTGAITGVSATSTDYWPNVLYDTREGNLRDGMPTNNYEIALGGVIHYVELDVNNLRRWLEGDPAYAGGTGTQTVSNGGYIVYFSDRRGNRTAPLPLGAETGEFGYEDFVNPAVAAGTPNGVPDAGEDVNGNATQELYGGTSTALPTWAVPYNTIATPYARHDGSGNASLYFRANQHVFFRRALKLVNGGLGLVPSPGFTVASENPVYVQGNYNATATDTAAEPNRACAIIADAVTFLSNNWNDINSFRYPNNVSNRSASATGFRVAVIAGKSRPFPRPTAWTSRVDFGTDGGAHDFLRFLESWGGTSSSPHLRYSGSLVSFYTTRQAVGTYKSGDTNVFAIAFRAVTFDADFLAPLTLPPGTPSFRDVNTLTFRQLLRPTQ
jgi:hypothetical protein